MTVENVFSMLCGLGLFLFGMKLMGEGLELAAGSKLRILIEKLTQNKYLGALVGIIVTAIIQSSSATTVMVVGFVNAGLMNLTQAVGVIMGANIGTTVTGIMIAINLTKLAPFAIFIGVIMLSFAKRAKVRHVGQIITGFGILFFGMETMSSSMAPLAQSPTFKDLIISLENPFIGLLIGLAFTAVIQSSSASIGVLQALGMAGVITLPSAIFVIYGQNIGTCATTILSSIGTNKTAKRTAVIHLLFNVIGTVLFVIITLLFPFTSFIEGLAPNNIMAQISIIHVIFNVVTTLILLPFSNILIKASYKIIKGEDKKKNELCLKFLDQRILNTPPIAVTQLQKEVQRMSSLAFENFKTSIDALLNKSDSQKSLIYKNEETIDFLNKEITEYLVKINSLDISDKDRNFLGSLFNVVNDIERVGDHCENIFQLAQTMIKRKESFSKYAICEIKQINSMVSSILEESLTFLFAEELDLKRLVTISETEREIDVMVETIKDKCIKRLNCCECNASAGTIFMDLLINFERIADHSINIAFYVTEKKFQKK